jgi:hypothetical protein
VDGVHCRINELVHPTLAKNTKLYSHKFNQAGLDYELAVSIRESRLVWMNGPFDGSKHDITIFRERLKEMTPLGKNGIADKGYRGEKGILCTPNAYDNLALQKFKVSKQAAFFFIVFGLCSALLLMHADFLKQTRARCRHETFNAKIKCYTCLDDRFRHGRDHHKQCFEAVCVIVQYQMENGAPLFDI